MSLEKKMDETIRQAAELGRMDGRLEALQKTVERMDSKLDVVLNRQDGHGKEIERIKTTGKVLHTIGMGIAAFIGWLAHFFNRQGA